MRIVSLDELTEEMKLAREIIDPENGRILLGVGSTRLVHFAGRLRAIGVNYLCVEDPLIADVVIPASVPDEIRLIAEESLEKVYERFEIHQQPDYGLVKQAIQELIAGILSNREMLVSVNEMRCKGGDFLGHSVNVAFLSLLLANRLGYDLAKMKKLGMGALLHDIGVAGMPKALLAKRGSLTVEEKLMYEQHPVIGYNLVKDSWEISSLSRGVILSHHERSNGSGYPHRLLTGDIHEFSRIVGLADCFEELAGGHPFSQQLNIQEAIEMLSIKAEEWFDSRLVAFFISLIPICQTGTTVRLSDGTKGIVVAQNPGFPTRPVIRIFQDADGNRIDPAQEVDLMRNHHLILQ